MYSQTEVSEKNKENKIEKSQKIVDFFQSQLKIINTSNQVKP